MMKVTSLSLQASASDLVAAPQPVHAAREVTTARETNPTGLQQPHVSPQADRARAEALRAAREAQREQETVDNTAGSVQFDQEDGMRVMKVLDSRDVLIYQVPTKGELSLVKNDDLLARRMRASA